MTAARRFQRWSPPRWLSRLGASLMLGGQAVSAMAKGRIHGGDLSAELMEAGPGSVLIVLITGLAAGTVFNIQVAAELSSQGANAQLGTMKVTEQIDAIIMLRTDPVDYLVVPRLLALLIMSPVQCLLFFWMALWSGQMSSTLLYSIPPSVFWTSVRTWMEPDDVPSMLLKSVIFGLIIAVLACGWGLTTKGGPKEVGASTTGAVVMILVCVALADVVLTQVLFGD